MEGEGTKDQIRIDQKFLVASQKWDHLSIIADHLISSPDVWSCLVMRRQWWDTIWYVTWSCLFLFDCDDLLRSAPQHCPLLTEHLSMLQNGTSWHAAPPRFCRAGWGHRSQCDWALFQLLQQPSWPWDYHTDVPWLPGLTPYTDVALATWAYCTGILLSSKFIKVRAVVVSGTCLQKMLMTAWHLTIPTLILSVQGSSKAIQAVERGLLCQEPCSKALVPGVLLGLLSLTVRHQSIHGGHDRRWW